MPAVKKTVKAKSPKPAVKVAPIPLSPAQRLDAIGIEAICACIADGYSLRKWAIKNNFHPKTVENWIEGNSDHATHYAHAREARAENVFESLNDVSDQAARAESAVEVAGLRLKSDNMKWMLARMSPKKYGDKLDITSQVTITSMSDDDLDAKLIEIQKQLKA